MPNIVHNNMIIFTPSRARTEQLAAFIQSSGEIYEGLRFWKNRAALAARFSSWGMKRAQKHSNNQDGQPIIHLLAFVGWDVCRKGTGLSNQEFRRTSCSTDTATPAGKPKDQEADARCELQRSIPLGMGQNRPGSFRSL